MTLPGTDEQVKHIGRRRYDRKSFFMVIDYALKDRAYRDFIQDISEGGIFVETRNKFPVGQLISMTFPIPGHSGQVKIKGLIVRNTSNGIGVTFYPPSRGTSLRLKPFVELL